MTHWCIPGHCHKESDVAYHATRWSNPSRKRLEMTARIAQLQHQAPSIIVIDDIEHSIATTIRQLVMHKIHWPGMVDTFRYDQWFWLLPDQPFARFTAQVPGISDTLAYGCSHSFWHCAGTGNKAQNLSCAAIRLIEPTSLRSPHFHRWALPGKDSKSHWFQRYGRSFEQTDCDLQQAP